MLKILQKMILQMKIVRNNHRNIIEYLEKNGGKEMNEKNKKLDPLLFEGMPRYEDYKSESEFQEAIDKFLDNDSLELENIFFCRNSNSQSSFTCPLLENEEGLVINSIGINPTSY